MEALHLSFLLFFLPSSDLATVHVTAHWGHVSLVGQIKLVAVSDLTAHIVRRLRYGVLAGGWTILIIIGIDIELLVVVVPRRTQRSCLILISSTYSILIVAERRPLLIRSQMLAAGEGAVLARYGVEDQAVRYLLLGVVALELIVVVILTHLHLTLFEHDRLPALVDHHLYFGTLLCIWMLLKLLMVRTRAAALVSSNALVFGSIGGW